MKERTMLLPADALRLARGGAFATVVTIMPDGHPQAQLTWVDTDGEHLLINTQPLRQRTTNVRRDPRITVLLHSPTDPWDWAEVRGRVVGTIDGDAAVEHVHALAQRYLGRRYGNPIGPRGRIILQIAADKVNVPASVPKIPRDPEDRSPGS
jgi:PPOX class probable F420-dependent enzyme